MDIRHDKSILSIYRKCRYCLEIYDATEDLDVVEPVCENCMSSETHEKHLETLPASGYSSLLPYQVPQVREFLLSIFLDTPPSVIIDASAHIGGDTIHFATLWPQCKITAIDIDQKAIKCLKSNVEKFCPNSENVEIVSADSIEWITENLRNADFYYFDPPWGGPKYCSEDEVSLFLSGKSISEIINFVLDNKLTSKVILKAPRNFAYQKFKKEVQDVHTRLYYIRKPQKRGSIAYQLILIWKS
jgi:precorrin-6B methylase 2